MATASVTVTIKGLQRASDAFRMLDAESRKRVRAGVIASLAEAKAIALTLVPRRTEELAATIRTEMPPDETGVRPIGYLMAGYGSLKRRSRAKTARGKARHRKLTLANTQPGVYAMVEEFGDAKRNHAAHPYIVPAIEQTRPHHMQRMADAMKNSVDAAARVGGGDAA